MLHDFLANVRGCPNGFEVVAKHNAVVAVTGIVFLSVAAIFSKKVQKGYIVLA
ncbi:hypothetical protein FC82_GL002990 [Secundilactobacillus collinoides DSM 20515 = JCM 1123]|uniref:Uncharacterized protein n=1 Tax=Secundilactobacillus collinoides DSM 20515 = JCM 1123 TaxID=1423733 RepID=A0A0R2BEZ7_SECCO|nr:hypothetical protein FC82_GL002990 [Secundilactobacillus collinoides DSM 20515 = JCM 1123]